MTPNQIKKNIEGFRATVKHLDKEWRRADRELDRAIDKEDRAAENALNKEINQLDAHMKKINQIIWSMNF